VLALLQELRELHGMTILMVTNDDDVAEHADRTLTLRDGVVGEGVIRSEVPRSESA
jgi:ABC-type lipoprotein export system ATPase subunit